MRTLALTTAVIVSLLTIVKAQSGPVLDRPDRTVNQSKGRLPVKRVVLYKNGIGYFEHSARVRGAQELNIDFTTAQLNDVINSLTLVDLGEGHIADVRFNSVAPLSERLRALHLPLGEQTSRAEFLNALRGSRVEVHSGNVSAAGRVLSVDVRQAPGSKGDPARELTDLSLVTDTGELRSFEIGPATSVRVADRDLTEEVGHYLSLIGSAKAMDLRRMVISAVGEGERQVFVSYISEVPVWKSTYRILLPDKPGEKALIQGWAVVDNTIGEDWRDVRLSLVAGAPQSFIQEISQPYYVRRALVALPQSMMLTPQTHEVAMMPEPPPPPAKGVGEGYGGVGGGAYPISGRWTAGLEGTVKDPAGAVVPNARVTVRNEETGASQTTTTDSQGHYTFVNVQAGNSALFVDAAGFQPFELSSIYLGVARMN
jgi:hypothetical protein